MVKRRIEKRRHRLFQKMTCNISQRSKDVMQKVGHVTKYWISLEFEAKVNFLQWPEANLALKLDVVSFKCILQRLIRHSKILVLLLSRYIILT